MDTVPDLVRDSKLETIFHSRYFAHRYHEVDLANGARSIREERWRRQRLIGTGAYGRVWLEKCVRGGNGRESRAVKEIIKPPSMRRPDQYNRELEAIAKFSHSRYVRCFVESLGWFERENLIYIAMEYCSLGDLDNYLAISQPLAENEARDIVYQLLEGLHFLHENGFAHRDLKPSNILIMRKPPDAWWVKIGDFGISKRAGTAAQAASSLKGTLGFMPPELHGFVPSADCFTDDGQAAACAADIWALGEMTFQLLTKRSVFQNMKEIDAFVSDPRIFPSSILRDHGVSTQGEEFIRLMMQAAPRQRITVSQALSTAWISPCKAPSPRPPTLASIESSDGEDFFDLDDQHNPEASNSWSIISSDTAVHPVLQEQGSSAALRSVLLNVHLDPETRAKTERELTDLSTPSNDVQEGLKDASTVPIPPPKSATTAEQASKTVTPSIVKGSVAEYPWTAVRRLNRPPETPQKLDATALPPDQASKTVTPPMVNVSIVADPWTTELGRLNKFTDDVDRQPSPLPKVKVEHIDYDHISNKSWIEAVNAIPPSEVPWVMTLQSPKDPEKTSPGYPPFRVWDSASGKVIDAKLKIVGYIESAEIGKFRGRQVVPMHFDGKVFAGWQIIDNARPTSTLSNESTLRSNNLEATVSIEIARPVSTVQSIVISTSGDESSLQDLQLAPAASKPRRRVIIMKRKHLEIMIAHHPDYLKANGLLTSRKLEEFTHFVYTAVIDPPEELAQQRYKMRANIYRKPPVTNLLVRCHFECWPRKDDFEGLMLNIWNALDELCRSEKFQATAGTDEPWKRVVVALAGPDDESYSEVKTVMQQFGLGMEWPKQGDMVPLDVTDKGNVVIGQIEKDADLPRKFNGCPVTAHLFQSTSVSHGDPSGELDVKEEQSNDIYGMDRSPIQFVLCLQNLPAASPTDTIFKFAESMTDAFGSMLAPNLEISYLYGKRDRYMYSGQVRISKKSWAFNWSANHAELGERMQLTGSFRTMNSSTETAKSSKSNPIIDKFSVYPKSFLSRPWRVPGTTSDE